MTKVFGIEIPSRKPKQVAPVQPEQAMDKNFNAGEPGVNLIPDTVLKRYAVQKLKKQFGIASILIVVVLALAFVGKGFISNSQEAVLADLDEEAANLSATAQTLTASRSYVERVDAKRNALVGRLGNDINYSATLDAIRNAADQSNVTLSSIQLSPASTNADLTGGGDPSAAQGALCPSPDPFNPSSGIACITFSGESGSVDSATAFGAALKGNSAFLNAYIQNVTTVEDKVNFEGSVSITPDLYNTRFNYLRTPIMEMIQQTEGDDSATDTSEEAGQQETDAEGQSE